MVPMRLRDFWISEVNHSINSKIDELKDENSNELESFIEKKTIEWFDCYNIREDIKAIDNLYEEIQLRGKRLKKEMKKLFRRKITANISNRRHYSDIPYDIKSLLRPVEKDDFGKIYGKFADYSRRSLEKDWMKKSKIGKKCAKLEDIKSDVRRSIMAVNIPGDFMKQITSLLSDAGCKLDMMNNDKLLNK